MQQPGGGGVRGWGERVDGGEGVGCREPGVGVGGRIGGSECSGVRMWCGLRWWGSAGAWVEVGVWGGAGTFQF